MAGVTSVVIDGTTYLVDDINAVDFSEDQGLSEQQQQQGRSNIGAAAAAALAGKADKADLVALEGTVGELSDDVDGLTEDKADVIVDTASGAIASFPDGAAVAAKDITIGIEPVQSGSGDPSPENVRPISGWTGANVSRTGKNLLPMTLARIKTINTNGSWSENAYTFNGLTFTVLMDADNNVTGVKVTGTATGTAGFNICSSQALTGNFIINGCPSGGSNTTYRIDARSTNPVAVLCEEYGSGASFTGSGDVIGYIRIQSGYACPTDGLLFKPMIRLASVTDSTFVPYTGTTIPISWQSEAGTVYGGTLDVTTGLLTVTHGNIASYNGESLPGRWISSMDVYSAGGTPTTGAQVVYELAAPQTYQLTPTEVEMLLGDNNVWADTGDSTVTYRADTKLYIQKINAPTDDDMIADAQIASGRYFIVGGNLYQSTTTIPAGDTITPGTNCILTNLADALNALNT